MAQVNVTIAGKSYRMACGEGEEGHLTALAAGFDARITQMRESFGEIGDMRLHVMAALMISDEIAELKQRIGTQDTEIAALRAIAASAEAERTSDQTRIAESVDAAAERISRLAKALAAPRA